MFPSKLYIYLLFNLLIVFSSAAQYKVLIHSHNDYHQMVPFYQAYAQQLDSYEADVYYDEQMQQLLVAHDKADILALNTLENLYILPIVKQYRAHGGKAWQASSKSFYLLIDIKEKHPQLIQSLLKLLQAYPDVFDKAKNAYAPTIVLTGSCPSPDEFEMYPSILYFDGRPNLNYTPQQLSRIAFISDSFRSYSVWNGKGSIKPAEKQRLMSVIEKVHKQNCKIRFWASPDNVNSWQIFRNMGVDIINTDKPELCAAFFKNEAKNNFHFSNVANALYDSIKTDRLDKTTGSFKGFSNTDVPARPIAVYQPTGKNDGANEIPLNIILLIGDGMGVAQLSAADLVNGGLTMSKMNFIGLQRTQPKGSFITDSAGAGSALATGVQTNNRHIATTSTGEANVSLTELMYLNDKRCGIVTNGNIADATPAAFYAHVSERDESDSITAFLLQRKLWFLAGCGESVITKRKDGLDLNKKLMNNYNLYQSIADSIRPNYPSIIIDEALAEATTTHNLTLLATTTRKAIQQLDNEKGFFLMVEGAKIDYAGHANSVPNCITEMLGFDLAVKEALEFADRNGQTLVVVSGDHETGGLTIIDGNTAEGRITGLFTSDDHTPVFLPVFAYGPGAQYFTGLYDNTSVFSKICRFIYLK